MDTQAPRPWGSQTCKTAWSPGLYMSTWCNCGDKQNILVTAVSGFTRRSRERRPGDRRRAGPLRGSGPVDQSPFSVPAPRPQPPPSKRRVSQHVPLCHPELGWHGKGLKILCMAFRSLLPARGISKTFNVGTASAQMHPAQHLEHDPQIP